MEATVIERTLSDGSKVYDVEYDYITDGRVIAAPSKEDAEAIAECLNKHGL